MSLKIFTIYNLIFDITIMLKHATNSRELQILFIRKQEFEN